MKKKDIKGLYLVTDRDLCLGRSLEQVVHDCLWGGAAVVQLREKDLSTKTFISEAQQIKILLEPYKVPLIINDRIDVAMAVGADGVHIGQEDMPYNLARKLLGPEAIIGLTVENKAQVREAETLDADYLGVSPIFETPTKTDTKGSWGLEGLAWARNNSRHILVAIGGLNEGNTAEAILAGADSIAVVSALCSASDPQRAAERLSSIIKTNQKVTE